MMQTLLFLKNLGEHVLFKTATESSFLISIGVLFHSLVAETAKERPPSVQGHPTAIFGKISVRKTI